MKKVFTTLVLFQFFVCSFSQVNPLLQTSWGQNCFYNDSCPSMTGGYCGKAVTGCVATATAQILKYYSYPTSGMGSHCNYHFPTNCVNFSKETYDYTIMSNSLTSSDPEVAKLMYDVGVSVDMLWGATESTAGDMSVPMKSYFGYSPKMYYQPVSSIDTTTLIQKIKTELDAGRPVIIVSFTGDHDYIIDGYNSTNGFHCNFGWAGLYNGYYHITNVVNPAGNFYPSEVYFNVMPLQGELEVNVGEGKDTVVTDTIVFNAQGIISGSSELFEYSTTTNWSLYTKDGSWLTMYPANSPNPSDSVSGTPGYYPFNIVIVNGPNTGATRYGHVIIKSATKTDTIVVKQLGDITTAILNPADVPNIQAYPNPANGHITFTIEDKYLPGIVKITDM